MDREKPPSRLATLLLAAGLLIFAAAIVMGDRFGPWIDALRHEARSRLEQFVDREQYRLSLADAEVRQARHTILVLRQTAEAQRRNAESLDGRCAAARNAGQQTRDQLRNLEERIRDGDTLKLVSGQELGAEEIEVRLQALKDQLRQQDGHALDLHDMAARNQVWLDQVLARDRTAPAALQRLERLFEHLTEKLRACEQQQRLLDATRTSVSERETLFEPSRRALMTAYAELEAELRGFKATYGEPKP